MKFGDIVKSVGTEGTEKHVPVIEIGKGRGREDVDVVRIVVGRDVPHPNTPEHHIAWVELYGMRNDGQVIDLGRANFAPSYTNPNVRFQVPVKEFKAFCALSYCNIHGVWQNCIKI